MLDRIIYNYLRPILLFFFIHVIIERLAVKPDLLLESYILSFQINRLFHNWHSIETAIPYEQSYQILFQFRLKN